jgi:hypothetical protein
MRIPRELIERIDQAASNDLLSRSNRGGVEASCVFRALMRYEVKQHDFKMFEADS